VDSIAEYFLLKTAVKDSLKNRWCFWRHKPHCNQSDQRVIVNQWISVEWVEAGLICIFIEPQILKN